MTTDELDTEGLKVVLAGELGKLVRRMRDRAAPVLPEAVECALRDWRFGDVVNRLQDECNKLTEEYYADLSSIGINRESIVIGWFKEYVWFQELFLCWKRLESKFIDAGIEFSVPR